jgi:hypothetical protein
MFSKNQWSKKEDKRLCKRCSGDSVVSVGTKNIPTQMEVPSQLAQQNANLAPPSTQQVISMDMVLFPILQQLQQENETLKQDLAKYKLNEKQHLVEISQFSKMVPELHSEIERLKKENDSLRQQIRDLEEKVDNLTVQVKYLLNSKRREHKLAIRMLIDSIRKDESKWEKLSQNAKNTVKGLKNEVNKAAHNLSEEQIKEAIESEQSVSRKQCYLEMYCIFFEREYEESEWDV